MTKHIKVSQLVCLILALIIGLILLSAIGHAESTMLPLSRDGGMVDPIPHPGWATEEERLRAVEKAASAYCLDGYHLEHRSTGLICVRPAGR